jgi:hydroxyacyl-ACP dehydratase HTD2-like protein with hotdog domain
MANQAARGAAGVPFRVPVERGKVLEFAAATRSANPAYWADECPFIPPTFLTTQMFWQEWAAGANPWPLVELDQQRGLHAEQEYVFHGPPPRAGSVLVARSRIADVYEKAGRGGTLTFAVMVTEFRDESGRLVAEARQTGVETAGPPTKQTPPPEEAQ